MDLSNESPMLMERLVESFVLNGYALRADKQRQFFHRLRPDVVPAPRARSFNRFFLSGPVRDPFLEFLTKKEIYGVEFHRWSIFIYLDANTDLRINLYSRTRTTLLSFMVSQLLVDAFTLCTVYTLVCSYSNVI